MILACSAPAATSSEQIHLSARCQSSGIVGFADLIAQEIQIGGFLLDCHRHGHYLADDEIGIARRPDLNSAWTAPTTIVASAEQSAVVKHSIDVTEAASAPPRD